MGDTAMSVPRLCVSLLCLFLVGFSDCELVDNKAKDAECVGKVTLYEGTGETVVTEDDNVDVTVEKVKLEGVVASLSMQTKMGKEEASFLGEEESTVLLILGLPELDLLDKHLVIGGLCQSGELSLLWCCWWGWWR